MLASDVWSGLPPSPLNGFGATGKPDTIERVVD
jgi:hypothetical protein